MKTLYLHIGTPKTATSSLQLFLDRNQDLLRSANFSYQVSPIHYSSKNIRRNAFFLNGPDRNKSLTEKEDRQYQERLSAGLSFLHEQFSACDNVIATDEHLWFSFSYSRWDPLQIILDDAAANDYAVKVLVYLRRQDGYLTSNWNQLVKKGTLKRTFEKQLKRILTKFPLLVCYDQALERVASRIGKENLIVRRFQADSWTGGSVFTDFLDALGVDATLPFEIPSEKHNPGLPLNFAELKRIINGNRFLVGEDRERILSSFKKAAAHSKDDHGFSLLSAEETRELLDRFAEGNAVVAEKYIGDGKPLFDDEISKREKWQPDNAFMTEDYQAFLSTLSDKERQLYLSSTILEEQRELMEETRELLDRFAKGKEWQPDNAFTPEDDQVFLSALSDKERQLYLSSTISEQQKELMELKEKTGELEKKCKEQEYTLKKIRALRHPIRALFTRE